MTALVHERIPGAALDANAAQRTFRAVLDALTRPGSVHRLPAELLRRVPAALLPALALADLGTPVCVLDEEPGGPWQDVLSRVTSAPAAPLPGARIVAALRPPVAAELAAVPRGSAAAPEDAALVTVPVSDVARGGHLLRLTGPGIATTVQVAPGGLAPELLAARRDAVAGFPAGIDLLLVDGDGGVLGLPRSTRIEEN